MQEPCSLRHVSGRSFAWLKLGCLCLVLCTLARADTQPSACGEHSHDFTCNRGMCVTRGGYIALRKYTSFGVHLAVQHFGARPGTHPNIDPWGSGGMAWPGLLGAVGDFLLFSSCCFQKGVSVTMFGRESRPTVCFERRIAQYKCFGDAYLYLSMSLYCLLSELKAKPTKPVCACGFASAAT